MDFGSYARVVVPERLANAMQPRGDHLRSVSQCCGAHPAGLEVQNHQKSLEITDFHYGPLLCLAGRRASGRHFPRPDHRFLVDFGSYARVVAPERRANALETRATHLASTALCLERSPGAHSHPDRKMGKFSKMEAVRPHRDLGALYTNFSKVEQGRSLDGNCSAC